MNPKWRHDDDRIPVRVYVDRTLEGLRAYHDTTMRMLQEEIDRRVGELIRERDARFTEISNRVEVASQALDHRLESMNEFRAQMREQAVTFVRQDTLSSLDASIADRLDKIEAALDRARGRMTVYAGLSGILVVGIALITLAANHIRL